MINQRRNSKLMIRSKALLKFLNKTQLTLIKKFKSDSVYYSFLLKKLIMEGMAKMMEPIIIVQCLQRDKIAVKEVIQECENDFFNLTQKELGEGKKIQLILDEKKFLLKRDIPDLSKIDVYKLDEGHELSMTLTHADNEKYW